MTIRDLIKSNQFEILSEGSEPDRKLTVPYCCDLLSIAMGNAPAGCVWCTVMGNMNTLAVASLTEAGCIILCGSVSADEAMIRKAESEGIPLFRTEQPIFETALWVYEKINEAPEL